MITRTFTGEIKIWASTLMSDDVMYTAAVQLCRQLRQMDIDDLLLLRKRKKTRRVVVLWTQTSQHPLSWRFSSPGYQRLIVIWHRTNCLDTIKRWCGHHQKTHFLTPNFHTKYSKIWVLRVFFHMYPVAFCIWVTSNEEKENVYALAAHHCCPPSAGNFSVWAQGLVWRAGRLLQLKGNYRQQRKRGA